MAFEIGWVPIGQTRGAPCFLTFPDHQGPIFEHVVGCVRFEGGGQFYFCPEDHAKVVRWFKWWFDDMVEH